MVLFKVGTSSKALLITCVSRVLITCKSHVKLLSHCLNSISLFATYINSQKNCQCNPIIYIFVKNSPPNVTQMRPDFAVDTSFLMLMRRWYDNCVRVVPGEGCFMFSISILNKKCPISKFRCPILYQRVMTFNILLISMLHLTKMYDTHSLERTYKRRDIIKT